MSEKNQETQLELISCPNCGYENPKGTALCVACGANANKNEYVEMGNAYDRETHSFEELKKQEEQTQQDIGIAEFDQPSSIIAKLKDEGYILRSEIVELIKEKEAKIYKLEIGGKTKKQLKKNIEGKRNYL